jgi:hypothetical protein
MTFDYVDKRTTSKGCRIVANKAEGKNFWGVIKADGSFLVPLFFHNIVIDEDHGKKDVFRVDLSRKQEVHSYWIRDDGKWVDNGRDMIRGLFKFVGGYDY